MYKKTSSLLVFLSGIIIFVIAGIRIISWIVIYNLLVSNKIPPSQFLNQTIDSFKYLVENPFLMVVLFLTIAGGIIFVIASKKMKKPEKLFRWSVVSLVLGLIIISELKGGNIFGSTTAGILSVIGGIFGIIESSKESNTPIRNKS
jgi:hypothetical protein